jgi:glycine/D-amino acid oxidase-like deaminating enzyme
MQNAPSYWLETCNDALQSRPSLSASENVDVAIVGAGFTGLWTAYYLKKKHPSLSITVIERRTVGFGASGRNGGWCTPKFSVTPTSVIKRFGLETAKALQSTMYESVEEVGRVIQEEQIDAQWLKSGSLQVAVGDHGLPSLEASLKTYKQLGFESHYELLNEQQAQSRVLIHGMKGALFSRESAVLHPGRLVRHLARRLEKLGVTIFENTEVLNYVAGGPNTSPSVVTNSGTISARVAVVLAGEAYLSQFPELHRQLIPMYSSIVLSEPLNEEQLKAIDWASRETIGSTRLSVDYLQKTVDNRILFGGRGEPYHYNSRIDDTYDKNVQIKNFLEGLMKKWFPSLSPLRVTHFWAGPLGVTRDWMPNFRFSRETKIASAWGYVGQGVSTTNLAGRVLSSLILEEENELIHLPMVQHVSPPWEPEPLRWMGIRFVQRGLTKVDRKAEVSGTPPTGNTIAERLSRH